ncbi:hypothetical protein C8Q80DRAFT_1267011 [Daedaleopsis nitida]|nr:hypothetical protein C8Q80DRAFT_1267011 [Daedaleopsis nitida]
MKTMLNVFAAILAVAGSVSAAPASETESAPPLVIQTPFDLRQCIRSYFNIAGGVPGYNLVGTFIPALCGIVISLFVDHVDRVTWYNVDTPFSWQAIVHEGSLVQFTVEDSVGHTASTIPVHVKHGEAPSEANDCSLIN